MLILGIQDSADAGAAIIKDGKIIAAINEERLSRIKLHAGYYYGWPFLSCKKVFDISNIKPHEIDYIAVAGIVDVPLPARLMGYYGVRKNSFLGANFNENKLPTRFESDSRPLPDS